ncbi:MAG: type II toxin-antitoxin system Phd/YefM family antitoxin [Candidatus Dormibacteria bacterium]
MTEQMGVRELRQGLSRALRRVRSGETLEVTDHGRPVARLVPIGVRSAGLEDLFASGRLRPPLSPAPLPGALEIASTMSSEEAVSRLRGA